MSKLQLAANACKRLTIHIYTKFGGIRSVDDPDSSVVGKQRHMTDTDSV